MKFIAPGLQLSGTTEVSTIITGITSGLTTLTDNDSRLVTEKAIKNYVDINTESGNLSGLTDVSITNPIDDEILVYQGGNWVNSGQTSSISGISNPHENALLINDGTITGITAQSNLLYENESLILNDTLETYATGITLLNSTTSYINLTSTGVTNTVTIEYKAIRNNEFMGGDIEIIFISGTTLYIDDSEYSITEDIGLSFDADVDNGIIRLETTVTDNTYDINFKYIRKIIK